MPYIFPIIEEYKDQIIEKTQTVLQNLSILVIALSTGSGKSLEIPNLLLDNCKLKKQTIMITNPTRLAAYELCSSQKEIQKYRKTNRSVSFAAGGDNQYTSSTSIVYATTGHFLVRLLHNLHRLLKTYGETDWKKYPVIDFVGALIIDEIHCPCKENEVILQLISFLMKEQPLLILPIIICSATASISDLQKRFINKIDIIDGTKRMYPIIDHYHDHNYPILSPDGLKSLEKDIIEKVVSVTKKHQTGDIIVFLAGSAQVDQAVENLEAVLPSTYVILKAYSNLDDTELSYINMSLKDLETVFEEKEGSYLRKIIVATNIAETSITINGAEIVIDSMVEKLLQPIYKTVSIDGALKTVETERTVLEGHLISKSSSKQRKGRIGRLTAGHYYPMCTKQELDNLSDYAENEFYRCPLDKILLDFISLELKPMQLLTIAEDRYKVTIDRMLEQKLLDTDNKVTLLGKFCANVPVEIKNAHWLYLAKDQQELFNLVLLLVSIFEGIESSPVFYYPKKQRGVSNSDYFDLLDTHKQKYFKKFEQPCDFMMLLNLVSTMFSETAGKYKNWARENSLNNKTLQSIRVRIYQLFKHFKLDKQMEHIITSVDVGDIKLVELLQKAKELMIEIMPHNIYTFVMGSGQSYYRSSDPKDCIRYHINKRCSLNNFEDECINKVVGYSTVFVRGNRGMMTGLINYVFEIIDPLCDDMPLDFSIDDF